MIDNIEFNHLRNLFMTEKVKRSVRQIAKLNNRSMID